MKRRWFAALLTLVLLRWLHRTGSRLFAAL